MTSVNKLSISTVRLQMQYINPVTKNAINLAIGTGFFWKSSKNIFVITNKHNITGRHFETNEMLNKQGSIPNHLVGDFFVHSTEGEILENIFTVPLYVDDDATKKNWIEDSNGADIAAINFGLITSFPNVVCANEVVSDMIVNIGQDVFVLGYPKNISIQGLPIWKRASIASEPRLNAYREKPTILIDTATREGMSGSPVFAISQGSYQTSEGLKLMSGEPAQSFLGIYSGRLADDMLGAQLGIIWKKELIEEMIISVKI